MTLCIKQLQPQAVKQGERGISEANKHITSHSNVLNQTDAPPTMLIRSSDWGILVEQLIHPVLRFSTSPV